MTGMRTTTDQRLDQVASQTQGMMTMIGRLVNSVNPPPHPEHLPGQDPTQRPTGNRQSNANYGCFVCSQMGHFVKEFPRQASKRDDPTHGSYRISLSEWPRRDADVDSNTLWEQKQVLSILERIPRGTEFRAGNEGAFSVMCRVIEK